MNHGWGHGSARRALCRALAESRVTRYSVTCQKGRRETRRMITRSTRSDAVTSFQPETGNRPPEDLRAELAAVGVLGALVTRLGERRG